MTSILVCSLASIRRALAIAHANCTVLERDDRDHFSDQLVTLHHRIFRLDSLAQRIDAHLRQRRMRRFERTLAVDEALQTGIPF